MAGTSFYSSYLFSPSNLGTSSPVLKTHNARAAPWKLPQRRRCRIKAEVDYVNAEQAKDLVAVEGYKVLDVRDRTQFERAHIKSSYHVPLFIENKDNDPGTILKRTLHNNFSGLFYGLPFTKPNPDFVQSVKSQFPPESKILVVCQEGLRSTAAASKLEQAGFSDVKSITSGLQKVKPGTFESVGSTELQNAGKAGLVTIQGKISAVLGTVLIGAYLFITFFPDQAEKLFQLVPAS
ncbi:hypothetical protein TanjilG_06897 [Lupinus angustifolius]|uniref:Rhodanese domain-containing protein n=1 Tax=Lupinus angustifolius TaxID=3871 RepID=A0A4P1QV76_LUPAN|nr:PREDICTED: rhodanese-like domain-containing protein 9, chloroplastic [Lupinus angustifolius]OIV95435.1 hypothetical protein TanjilG_06897 [Lupinus angustifolius]